LLGIFRTIIFRTVGTVGTGWNAIPTGKSAIPPLPSLRNCLIYIYLIIIMIYIYIAVGTVGTVGTKNGGWFEKKHGIKGGIPNKKSTIFS
jgi:hypothetical protein